MLATKGHDPVHLAIRYRVLDLSTESCIRLKSCIDASEQQYDSHGMNAGYTALVLSGCFVS